MTGPLRSDELLASILDTFEADLSLPEGGGIVPRSVAEQRDDLDPRVTVAVELTDTDRHNRRSDRTAPVSCWTDGTQAFVDTHGRLELKRIQNDVIDLLDGHGDGRRAVSLDTEGGPTWNDTINRYQGAVEFSVERRGAQRDN